MRSRWFENAGPASGGLFLPGGRGAADLLLREDGVYLVLGKRGFSLRWDRFPKGWAITSVASGRGGSGGVAVAVNDESRPAVDAMRRASVSRWLRWFPFIFTEATGVRVGHSAFISRDREIATLDALCEVLARRTDYRHLLGDAARMEQLATDLTRRSLLARFVPDGVRRTTMEVVIAMKALGLVHRHRGRPLPCESMPELSATVDAVRERIAASPYAVGVDVSDAEIARVLKRDYFDVDPWPFAALTC